MPVHAGTAFVDFEGDFSAINKQVSGHFSALSKEAGETGKKAGDALGGSMSKQASSHFTKLSQQAGDAGKKAGAALGGAMKLGIAGAGVAAGGLFMKGITDAISAEKANSKLAAQLGTSKATSKKMGKIAGKVYADAYGDSLGEVNDAIKGIVQNGIAKKTGKDVEGLTKKTLDLASAFDQDVGDATRGVGQLLRTGLVKDADQAFDVITKGFQKGGDKAGDLIDTLNEYSTQWRKLGLNAEEATGLISQGLRAGARDSDIVADALKEFSLRATGTLLKMTKTADGPKASLTALGEAFKAAGYDANSANPKIAALADNLQRDIAGGGEKAKKGLQVLLDGLRKTKDPLDRSRNAVALFGTQAEDLGDALFALDPSKAVDALGKTQGAAKKLGDTLNNNVAGNFEALKRKTFQSFQGVAAKYVLPEFNKILAIVNDPKLTTGEKWDKIGDTIGAAIRRSNLDDKLKQVGEEAADMIWDGFKAAPLWAKVGGGAFLATKLGLTGPALKGLTALLTGKGAGSGLGGIASKAAPIPVFVTNMGGLPGGKGPGGGIPPIIGDVGKGGGGILGKLRGVGKFAGKAGLAAAAADVVINLVDSKGNPISTLQNSAHDLTFGLIPEFKSATDKAAESIGKLKLKLAPDVQAQLPADFDAKMIGLQKQMDERLLAIRSRTNAANAQMSTAAPDKTGGIVAALTKANAGDVAKLAELGRTYGDTVATAYTTAISEHHQFFGANQLTKGFTAELQKLPENARQSAYDTMINWANTLVQQGRLPREALNTLVKNIDDKFSLLPAGVERGAKGAIDKLTAQFKRRDMITAADTMFSELKKRYGEFPSIAKTTGNNMATNFLAAIEALRKGAMTGTGKFKKQSKADLKDTRDAALKYAGDMNSGLNAELISMGVKGDKNAKKVRDNIIKAFTEMATGTGTASEATSSTLYKALTNMDVNAEEILSALGLSVPKVSLTRPPLAPDRAGPGAQMRPTQRGAYVSGGKPSGDSVPILAERGEYVLNREAVKKVGKGKLDQLNFGEAPRFQSGGFVQLVSKANQIDAKEYPYLWGGGHDGNFSGPYDCSGAISAILHAAGLLQMPMVSGDFMNFGKPGAGSQFTIYANAGHVYGKIGNRFWGTSGSNPGGGAGYFDGSARSGFAVRHVDMVNPTLAAQKITGMPGMLSDASQGILDKSRKSYQSYINAKIASAGSIGGGDDGDSATASGNGADLMRQISQARGWNFGDWWSLDARESSHGTNLSNPTSTARLRGQFLDSNWGKYGPGSDPRKNPSMGQQIESMAQYISERYGNPTRAWAAWQSHFPPGWYQRGGSVLKGFKKGGSTYKAPKVKVPFTSAETKEALAKMVASKPVFTNGKKIDSLSKSLAAIGYDRSWFDNLSGAVDIDAQWADVAAELTDTGKITEALQLDLEKRQLAMTGDQRTKLLEQTKNMLPSEQAKYITEQVFPEAAQKTIVDSMQGRVQGLTQLDWLNQELGDMLGLRNLILVDTPTVQAAIADVVKKISQAQALSAALEREINRIEAEIQAFTDKRADVSEERKRISDAIKPEQDAFDKAQKDLVAEHKKKKPSQSKIKSLNESIGKHRNHLDNLHYRYDVLTGGSSGQIAGANDYGDKNPYAHKHWHSLRFYDEHLHQDRLDNRKNTANKTRLDDTVIPAYEDRKDKLDTADSDLRSNLIDLQGQGVTMDLLPILPDLGVLAGKMHQVHLRRNDLTDNPTRVNAEVPSEPSQTTNPADEMLKQLLREANLRTAVSEAQFDVFKNFPFGGSFKEGGTVPGPYGAPRMILAHGGEVVIPNDASNAPAVSLHFANGMEWLRQFVDVRVGQTTRVQARSADRRLPGQPGVLR